jgi:hypothetical protein
MVSSDDNSSIQKPMALALVKPLPVDGSERDPGAAAEAEARKQRSIGLLTAEGVPVNEYLPTIEAEAEVPRRSSDEVALRAIALAIVARAAHGDREATRRLIAAYRIDDAFTPQERAFINDPQPTQRDRAQLTWRIECAWVLLWALGFVPALGRPDGQVDADAIVHILEDRGRDGVVAEARLRPQAHLLDAADLLYRYHWAIREAQLNGRPSPGGLNPGVVMEWHYAINWLIGYGDAAWDEISTDT